MKLEIKDNHNRIIGWVEDVGGRLQARHISKGYVGHYNKGSDITFDNSGRIYCYGNGVQCLVRDAERNLL